MRIGSSAGIVALLCAAAASVGWAQTSSTAPAAVIYTKDKPPATPKLEDLPLKESVSQYGITWTFEKPARVGQFVNGDWYVVGPVTVKAIDPAPADGVHGSMLNPQPSEYQGYAARNGVKDGQKDRIYKPELTAAPPVKMVPGDSLVSTITMDNGRTGRGYRLYGRHRGGGPDSVSKAAAVLTCLDAPVPPDTFRPSYCGRQRNRYRFIDLRLDLLPSLELTPSAPDIVEFARVFERPWIDHVWHWGSRHIHPAENMPEYGQQVANAVQDGALLLLGNAPLEKKGKLLIGFVQVGIDLAGCIERGAKGWPQAGGFGSGRKWPILFAGLLLGDEKMQHVKAAFGDDEGTMLDACWTGANVVFAGHSGKDGMGDPERGEYENLHPSRWPGTEGEGYRRCCNSHCWVGYALAARLMHAEKLWDHDAFFAYVDRWMTEDDEDAVNQLERAYKARGWNFGNMRNPYARQGHSWEDFVTEMWKAYRNSPGVAPNSYKAAAPVKTGNVRVDERGGFVVDGKPFLPIMLVEGEPNQVELAKSLGINTFLGSGWKNRGFDRPYKEFLDQLAKAGLYGVFGADARLAGNPHLLGYLQYDRPDRAKVIREADVTLDKPERGDRGHPPSLVADGDVTLGKGASLGPIEPGMEVTINVRDPVTAHSLAIVLATGYPTLPKEVVFLADGKEILKASIKRQDGQQKFDLKEPATFKTLAMKVLSVDAGLQKWGRIDEVQALDKDGKPIRLYTERREPSVTPDPLEDVYKWCKGRDSSKPVFLVFAEFASQQAQGLAEDRKSLYPQYLKHCDAAGFEYPGSGPAGGLADAVRVLRDAGTGRPVFVCLAPVAGEDAANLRAKVWAAIGSGATAVGYRLPSEQGATVLPDNLKAELKRLSEQVTRLGPAILAPPAKEKVEIALAGAKGHGKATDFGGAVYVFAQNLEPVKGDKPAAAKGTIKIEGLKAGTKIEVVDENRTITAEDGQFGDEFAPLAEHVYRVKS